MANKGVYSLVLILLIGTLYVQTSNAVRVTQQNTINPSDYLFYNMKSAEILTSDEGTVANCPNYFQQAGIDPTTCDAKWYLDFCNIYTPGGEPVQADQVNWNDTSSNAYFNQAWVCKGDGKWGLYYPSNCSWSFGEYSQDSHCSIDSEAPVVQVPDVPTLVQPVHNYAPQAEIQTTTPFQNTAPTAPTFQASEQVSLSNFDQSTASWNRRTQIQEQLQNAVNQANQGFAEGWNVNNIVSTDSTETASAQLDNYFSQLQTSDVEGISVVSHCGTTQVETGTETETETETESEAIAGPNSQYNNNKKNGGSWSFTWGTTELETFESIETSEAHYATGYIPYTPVINGESYEAYYATGYIPAQDDEEITLYETYVTNGESYEVPTTHYATGYIPYTPQEITTYETYVATEESSEAPIIQYATGYIPVITNGESYEAYYATAGLPYTPDNEEIITYETYVTNGESNEIPTTHYATGYIPSTPVTTNEESYEAPIIHYATGYIPYTPQEITTYETAENYGSVEEGPEIITYETYNGEIVYAPAPVQQDYEVYGKNSYYVPELTTSEVTTYESSGVDTYEVYDKTGYYVQPVYAPTQEAPEMITYETYGKAVYAPEAVSEEQVVYTEAPVPTPTNEGFAYYYQGYGQEVPVNEPLAYETYENPTVYTTETVSGEQVVYYTTASGEQVVYTQETPVYETSITYSPAQPEDFETYETYITYAPQQPDDFEGYSHEELVYGAPALAPEYVSETVEQSTALPTSDQDIVNNAVTSGSEVIITETTTVVTIIKGNGDITYTESHSIGADVEGESIYQTTVVDTTEGVIGHPQISTQVETTTTEGQTVTIESGTNQVAETYVSEGEVYTIETETSTITRAPEQYNQEQYIAYGANPEQYFIYYDGEAETATLYNGEATYETYVSEGEVYTIETETSTITRAPEQYYQEQYITYGVDQETNEGIVVTNTVNNNIVKHGNHMETYEFVPTSVTYGVEQSTYTAEQPTYTAEEFVTIYSAEDNIVNTHHGWYIGSEENVVASPQNNVVVIPSWNAQVTSTETTEVEATHVETELEEHYSSPVVVAEPTSYNYVSETTGNQVVVRFVCPSGIDAEATEDSPSFLE
jgi:hypothetical protein